MKSILSSKARDVTTTEPRHGRIRHCAVGATPGTARWSCLGLKSPCQIGIAAERDIVRVLAEQGLGGAVSADRPGHDAQSVDLLGERYRERPRWKDMTAGKFRRHSGHRSRAHRSASFDRRRGQHRSERWEARVWKRCAIISRPPEPGPTRQKRGAAGLPGGGTRSRA